MFVVQSLIPVWLFATPWTAARQISLSFIILSLLKPMSIDLVMPSNSLILCHPLLLLPSSFPSIRVFSSKSVLRIRWPEREKAEREGQVLLNPAPAWPLSAHAPRRHTGTLKRSKYWSRGERKAPEWIGIFPGAMFFRRWSGDLI